MMLSSVKVFHSCVILFLDHALDKVSSLLQDQALQSSEIVVTKALSLFTLYLELVQSKVFNILYVHECYLSN